MGCPVVRRAACKPRLEIARALIERG